MCQNYENCNCISICTMPWLWSMEVIFGEKTDNHVCKVYQKLVDKVFDCRNMIHLASQLMTDINRDLDMTLFTDETEELSIKHNALVKKIAVQQEAIMDILLGLDDESWKKLVDQSQLRDPLEPVLGETLESIAQRRTCREHQAETGAH
ncbi:hypothetical protein GGS20DRAFT_565733 [Poronia punctata]|nr:hypothetical protein GGS20DRAFT_565733 [Poronia punctata]